MATSATAIIADVLRRLEAAPDPRLRRILTSLVRHLHGFVTDVELTEREWCEAIRFLTETGQMCSDRRQEFILLSDTLEHATDDDDASRLGATPPFYSATFDFMLQPGSRE